MAHTMIVAVIASLRATFGLALVAALLCANAAHCSSIHGSTKSTYTEVAKDVGHSLGLTVRATDSTGVAEAYAAVTGLVANASSSLVATAQPALAGDPIVGTAIAVENAAWSATPTSTTYRWFRCNPNGRLCAEVAGQTAATYSLVTEDAGHTIVAAATAVAGAQTTTVLTVRSALVRTAPGPVVSAPPAIGGTPQQGKQLTGTPGTWTSGGSISYHYQWYRCDQNGAHCSSVHGATKATYTLVSKDVSHTIGLTVRATDATGTSPAYSSLAGLVAPPGAPLVATAQPAIGGTAAVGQSLTVGAVTWTGTPTGTTYAWLRCNENGRLCTPIPSETTASYEPTSADSGHVLVAEVIGTSGTIQQTVLSVGVLVTGV
jgi:fibronectin-binding autotransporter adhesin